MTELLVPANENADPLLHLAGTALEESYRLRREVLARDTSGHTFERWRERNEVLKKLNRGISLCLRRV